MSLDIDVMDPAYAPGTGAPTSGGLDPRQLVDALYRLGQCQQVRALDLVEIDPLKDLKEATPKMAAIIIMSFLAGVHARLRRHTARLG
jgi:formiminoglutamase